MISAKFSCLVFIIGVIVVNCYSDGAPDCVFPSTSDMSPGKSGTNGYSIDLTDFSTKTKITSYGKGQRINVVLSGSVGYKGYLVVARSGNVGSLQFTNIVGSFMPGSDQKSLGCGGITQTMERSSSTSNGDTFVWQAPDSSPSSVTFYAVVVTDKLDWYGQSNTISSATIMFNSSAPTYAYSTDTGNNNNNNNNSISPSSSASTIGIGIIISLVVLISLVLK